MKDIRNRIAVVTGGASGIGKLVAFGLAKKGARVIIVDLNPATLQSAEGLAASGNLPLTGMVCDVSDREAVYRLAGEIGKTFGPVDILVNNAGIVSGKSLLETSDDRIIKTMEVNTLSNFWTLKAFLPSMIERNSGHIVTISSVAGLIGVTGLADYSASKFAVFGLHEALRTELRRQKTKIATTVVCPLFINTGMFDGVQTRFPLLLPIMTSEYAAGRILKAIVKSNKRLIMPRFVYSIFLLRLLPVGVMDALVDFFGANHAMDQFKGRT